MVLGKVVGTVVSTRKEDELTGLKFLLVKACDVDGKPTGAITGAQSGIIALFDRLPKPSAEDEVAGMKKFFHELNRLGITGFVELELIEFRKIVEKSPSGGVIEPVGI